MEQTKKPHKSEKHANNKQQQQGNTNKPHKETNKRNNK